MNPQVLSLAMYILSDGEVSITILLTSFISFVMRLTCFSRYGNAILFFLFLIFEPQPQLGTKYILVTGFHLVEFGRTRVTHRVLSSSILKQAISPNLKNFLICYKIIIYVLQSILFFF